MKPKKPIESLILTLRGQKIILDADLAELYGVPTKAFNQAVKRNAGPFPEDFLFQLTANESSNLKSQIATSSVEVVQKEVFSELVTICDQFQTNIGCGLSPPGLHRTRRNHGGDGVEQPGSGGDERVCGAGVCPDARTPGRQRRHPQAAGRD